jgi:transposase
MLGKENKRGAAMTIPLRVDYDASGLRSLARKANDTTQARRLRAIAAIYDGSSRTRAAALGGVTPQIVRDWVVKFNTRGPDGLTNGDTVGTRSRLNEAQRAALATILERGPSLAIHGIVRWRLIDLCEWVQKEFRVKISLKTMSRERIALNHRRAYSGPATLPTSEARAGEAKKNINSCDRGRA